MMLLAFFRRFTRYFFLAVSSLRGKPEIIAARRTRARHPYTPHITTIDCRGLEPRLEAVEFCALASPRVDFQVT